MCVGAGGSGLGKEDQAKVRMCRGGEVSTKVRMCRDREVSTKVRMCRDREVSTKVRMCRGGEKDETKVKISAHVGAVSTRVRICVGVCVERKTRPGSEFV